MQEFTPEQKAAAEDAAGNLIAASTKPDGSIVIVLEDGRKLTYTAAKIAELTAGTRSEAKSEPKGKGKK